MANRMNRLKELRKRDGISFKKLSDELKEKYKIIVSSSQLMYYEKGEREPRNKELWGKLADFFKVSESYLLGYSSEPNVNFSPVRELKDDNDKVQKGKQIFQDFKGENAVKTFENDVLLWYTEKYNDIDGESPTPSFFADNFINQVYFTLAESQTFNNYLSLLLTDFFSLPYSEWDRIALMIAGYSEKLNKADED
ncbi:TPA: helix-turn-helix transcriptional regulator [Streptococcus equi subsp. zooepidemicus]|uniref:helix-turn-helix domain-containing protein n=1 Tax=Streptococcus equi TaxID=1336 RepID=UPI0010C49C66|nr:helix-turn-helix transcriptional regulator [Streptococcus equi]MCD3394739.1 helix-turn-helix domain-containing protein [Streptococcus equi subsp. zooepidemicus]MCD3450289.1 helix-turn-helix domain-containing protein [Streptococcus equi subsp. zooepidemicus]WOK57911.1 helix-turn-helix transcriptional regulator [Streptococcus equi subsp. zooepidemicus]VTP88300.1 phage-associated protein [Streptococcus equi subsp. zooepidemicus]HEK9995226.1 helix-turn-helix transcriptional regulator [Streptoco